jgi:hypothetical protein
VRSLRVCAECVADRGSLDGWSCAVCAAFGELGINKYSTPSKWMEHYRSSRPAINPSDGNPTTMSAFTDSSAIVVYRLAKSSDESSPSASGYPRSDVRRANLALSWRLDKKQRVVCAQVAACERRLGCATALRRATFSHLYPTVLECLFLK